MSDFKFSVKINGTEAPASLQIESIWIRKEFNKVPVLKVSFYDGGMSDEQFSVLKGLNATPGSEIEIGLGYASTKPVFKGIITKQSCQFSETSYLIELEARDKAIKLTSGRKSEIYQKKKDSDIINDLGKAAGLKISADATTVEHEEIVQYACSNWDFMLMRAELNSMLVNVSDGEIKVIKPKFSGSPVATLENGINVYNLQLEVDATHQYSKAKVVGWDYKNQKALEADVNAKDTITFGQTTSKKLSDVVNTDGYTLNTPLHVEQNKLQAWGEGKLLKASLNMVKGYLETIGDNLLVTGCIVEIKGFSKDFNGKLLVTGVEHEVREGNWKTTLRFGLPFSWFSEEVHDVSVPKSSGVTAAMPGLATGVVTKIDADPDGQYRVEVSIPVLGSAKGNLSVHARLASFYATNASGAFFYPEVNDEVLLGFLNEDPHQPVILGMLYSSKNKPPFEPDEKNQFKGFVSKSLITIKMDDVDKILTILTPGGNEFVMDDKEKQISLKDANQNVVTMNKDGITIESGKDIIMKATGNIKMEAQSNIEMKATADMKGAGMNVNLEAQVGIVAKGSATAEISASGQTTVKGAIVMIN